MTKFLRTTLPLIAAISATGIASQASADMLDITNCTGIGIRVHVYNNADAVQAIARAGGYIEANDTASYDVEGGLMALKIFQSGIIDTMRLSVSNVAGDRDHNVRISSEGRWLLVDGSSCG